MKLLIFGLILAIGFHFFWIRHFSNAIATDSAFYDVSALSIVSGRGFSVVRDGRLVPVYFHTPGYSFFLSLIYRFTPLNEPLTAQATRVTAVIWVQQLLFMVTLLAYFKMSQILWGRKTVKWQWLMLGLYYPFAWYSTMLLPETLAQAWLAIFLLLVVGRRFLKVQHQFWLGLWIGILLLIKPYFLYVPLVYALWYVFHLKSNREVLRGVMLFMVGVVVVTIGWIGRTYFVSGHLVLMQAGFNFVTTTSTLASGDSGTLLNPSPPPSVGELFFWHTVHKWRDLLAETDGKLALLQLTGTRWGGLIWWITQTFQVYLLGKFLLILFRFNVLKTEAKLLAGIIMGGLMMHAYIWSLPRYFMAILPILGILAGLKVDIPKGYYWRAIVMIGFLYGITIMPITSDTQFFMKSLISILTVSGGSYIVFKNLNRQNVGGRIATVSLIVLLAIAWWPGLMVLINPKIEWAYMPLPFIFRGNTGNLQ